MESDFICEPMKRKELRKMAKQLRKLLGLETTVYIPIVELLDVFEEMFQNFNYEIVEDDIFPENIHGDTDITTGQIRIKQSVYEGACDGNGRDRMTVAHELAHFILLCEFGLKLTRNFEKKKVNPCRDPEWQAKCFAGEFMISKELTRNFTIQEIQIKCGVSDEAAEYQYRKFMEEGDA